MGNIIHKLVEKTLTTQQHIYEFNLRLFIYIILRFSWLLLYIFMSIILDITFSIYLALKINSERTYILCIILILLLLIALYWIFTIIEKYYILNRLRLLQFNCWFITCHISTFSYFIVKFIIIIVYLPESMDDEDNFLISLIYFSISSNALLCWIHSLSSSFYSVHINIWFSAHNISFSVLLSSWTAN